MSTASRRFGPGAPKPEGLGRVFQLSHRRVAPTSGDRVTRRLLLSLPDTRPLEDLFCFLVQDFRIVAHPDI